MLSFFPLDVLDEIWDLIESVSEGFLPLDVLDEIWDLIESVSEGFLNYCFIKLPSIRLEICSGQKCDKRTDGRSGGQSSDYMLALRGA